MSEKVQGRLVVGLFTAALITAVVVADYVF